MTPSSTLGAWAELLRVSALFTVPGDAMAGAASIGVRPDRGTALAVGASLCLYEAGMALNDWADREEDAVDRPHRPIPSGRITPPAALAASAALTATGLMLAAGAGRPALAVASTLAATVWAYDLGLKHTPAASATMATARALDLLLGAAATGRGRGPLKAPPQPAPSRTVAPPRPPAVNRRTVWSAAGYGGGARKAVAAAGVGLGLGLGLVPAHQGLRDAGCSATPAVDGGGAALALRRLTSPGTLAAAAMLGAHTYAVTEVSRREAHGGSTAAPLAALAAATVLAALAARQRTPEAAPTLRREAAAPGGTGPSAPTFTPARCGGPEGPGGLRPVPGRAGSGEIPHPQPDPANQRWWPRVGAGSAPVPEPSCPWPLVDLARGPGVVVPGGAGWWPRVGARSAPVPDPSCPRPLADLARGPGAVVPGGAGWWPRVGARSAPVPDPSCPWPLVDLARGPGAVVRRGAGWGPRVGTGVTLTPAPNPSPHKAIRIAARIAARLATPAALAAAAYFRTAARPLLHAALNPSPPLTQRAVGGGIRAMIPLQAALAARSGAVGTGAAVMGLVPLARKLSRKVSPT
ncbi:UbiA family prenyltransferase [Streptomyces spiramyceticus]|uniref:UbiA family prenyltransferase n=1 Tax=Streptomyces spiramyceticus TaxID=299717 RepID=UPI00237A8BF6|nr:UbiA family prenyltransferase [Streptomyces spiramyceticus]